MARAEQRERPRNVVSGRSGSAETDVSGHLSREDSRSADHRESTRRNSTENYGNESFARLTCFVLRLAASP